MINLPGLFVILSDQLTGDEVLLDRDMKHHLSVTGYKILGPFQDDPHLFQVFKCQGALSAALDNTVGGFGADAGNSQKICVAGAVDLHREKLQVPQCPVALGVQHDIEVGPVSTQQFLCMKAVKPQQPVGLIETMFP